MEKLVCQSKPEFRFPGDQTRDYCIHETCLNYSLKRSSKSLAQVFPLFNIVPHKLEMRKKKRNGKKCEEDSDYEKIQNRGFLATLISHQHFPLSQTLFYLAVPRLNYIMENWMGYSPMIKQTKCLRFEKGSALQLVNKNLNLRSKPHVGGRKTSHVNNGVNFLNLQNTGSTPESL